MDDDQDGGFALQAEDDGDSEDNEELPTLTTDIIKGWQKALLEVLVHLAVAMYYCPSARVILLEAFIEGLAEAPRRIPFRYDDE